MSTPAQKFKVADIVSLSSLKQALQSQLTNQLLRTSPLRRSVVVRSSWPRM